jgi:hypothetical protein
VKAKLDHPRYLRGNTYYEYGNGNWSGRVGDGFGSQEAETLEREARQEEIASLRQQKQIEFELQVVLGHHERVYVPGMPIRVPISNTGNPFPISRDGTVMNYTIGGPPYTVDGLCLVPEEGVVPQTVTIPSYFSRDERIKLLDSSRATPRVREFAEAAARGQGSDYEKAMAIKRAIEGQVRYNLEAPATPSGMDPVDAFLFETKEGYCDLFASSMALCARSIGLPARTATGFYPNDPNADEAGFYTIKDVDYHMWCEIYFDGVGWVAFDPTEGAPAVPGEGRGSARSNGKAWYEATWVQQAIDIGLLALAAAVLLLAVKGMFGKSGPKLVQERTAVGKLYSRFSKLVERRSGKPRRLNETPREYLARVGPDLGAAELPASSLTQRFEVALYSPEPPSSADLKLLASEIADFRKVSPE